MTHKDLLALRARVATRLQEIHHDRAALDAEERDLLAVRRLVDGALRAQPSDVLAENERLVTETIEEQIEEGGQ